MINRTKKKDQRSLRLILSLLMMGAVSAFGQSSNNDSSNLSAQYPQLILPFGHSTPITAVAFSPTGRFVLTGSFDGVAILWDANTGQELRRLVSAEGEDLMGIKSIQTVLPSGVISAAFSPDEKYILIGLNSLVTLYDISTGHEIKRLENATAPATFSHEGRFILTRGADGLLLWDLETKRLLQRFQGTGYFHALAFSPDDRFISGTEDHTTVLWSIATGQEIRRFDQTGLFIVFSPDDRSILTGSLDEKVKDEPPQKYALLLRDLSSGREVRRFAGHIKNVVSATFSHDGQRLLTAGRDDTVRLWEVATGRELWQIKVERFRGAPDTVFPYSVGNAIAFSPNDQTILVGSGYDARFHEASTGRLTGRLEGKAVKSRDAVFSADGRSILTYYPTARLWNLKTGIQSQSFDGDGKTQVRAAAISADGHLVATSGPENTAQLWDALGGRQLQSLKGHTGQVTALAFSPGGNLIATASDDQTIRLWNVETAQATLRSKVTIAGVNFLSFSPDPELSDNRLLMLSTPSEAGLLDLTLDEHEYYPFKTLARDAASTGLERIFSLSISQNGRFAVGTGEYDLREIAVLWDVATGEELKRYLMNWATSAAVSPDGRYVLIGVASQAVILDAQTGKTIRWLKGQHSDWVNSVAFSPDGKFILTDSRDATSRIWETATGEELCRLISFPHGDWVVVTPSGLFDGSPGALRQVYWRFSSQIFDIAPIEAFYNEFYRPGLLAEMMAGKRPTAPQGTTIMQKDRRQIPIRVKTVEKIDASAPITSRTVTVEVEVAEAPAGADLSNQARQLPPSGAKDIRLFRNGTLVKLWRGPWGAQDGCQPQAPSAAPSPRRAICTATVPIVAGENRLTAYAFNRDNVKSLDGELMIHGAESLKRTGTLYVLAIGVGRYANLQYNLNYTAADARDFSAEIQRQQGRVKLYERVQTRLLLDEEAKKLTILAALKKLAATVQPEDGVIVYFSGHGTAQRDRFYLLPHDIGYMGSRRKLTAQGLQTILSHSISDMDLEEAFKEMDVTHLLLIIDACNSGQALEAEEKRRGPMNSKGLAQLAYEKGMSVLTASQSIELAFVSNTLKHSYLTYALVEEGLKTDAADDEPKDGQVLLREWFDFATGRVPLLREEILEQQAEQQNKSLKEVQAVEGGSVQQPRVFYRREAETQPFIVARP